MRVRPWRAVDGIGWRLHPTEVLLRAAAGRLEILLQCVARLGPLRSLAARVRAADFAPLAGRYVDQQQSEIGMIRVAQHLRTGPNRSDVPGDELGDGPHF